VILTEKQNRRKKNRAFKLAIDSNKKNALESYPGRFRKRSVLAATGGFPRAAAAATGAKVDIAIKLEAIHMKIDFYGIGSF
jgi:hypothetical protein